MPDRRGPRRDAGGDVRVTVTDRDSHETTEHLCTLPVVLGRVTAPDGPAPDGTAPDSIRLDDREVSRRHARLERADGELVVVDLGSSNGTFVNDRRVQRAAVTPRDRLRLGRFEMTCQVLDVEAAVTVARADATVLRSPERVSVAARDTLRQAEERNARAGHELAGFLSLAQGFTPLQAPQLAFPPSHAAWDGVIDELPDAFRRLGVRRAFDAMPVLDAGPQALPEAYLNRASTLLGVFAHAYQYMAIDPPQRLPDALWKPWQTVSQRLGKAVPSVSYTDLFLYNWRLTDPSGPRRLDNMDLLVPTWGNAAERVFYLVTTEFAMGLTPVVGAMVRAQEGVVADDRDVVEASLLEILDALHHVTQVVYPQIDPNPLGRHALDQVLWAKTVGTAGVPIVEGAPSPSGTAQPHIHALDAFLERQEYGSLVGRQSVYLAGHFPQHWREFVAALREVSVRGYVEATRSAALRGVYNAVLDAYAGDRGWMGLHRIKAYGFLEVAFKVGRQVTTGARFTGLFKDRTWDRVDDELAVVRTERLGALGPPVVFATARQGPVVIDPVTGAWTCHAELDVAGQGVFHRPGDRVGVLPENEDELVRRTVSALGATGDELLPLTPAWQAAVARRAGYAPETDVLPLRTVLRFARLRPVDRDVAKRLAARCAVGALERIVDARMEDQWELWDLLGLAHAGGYDVTRLWKAPPTDPEAFCALVAPEDFRLYSIASAPPEGAPAQTLKLVVGGLEYTSARSSWSYPRTRHGTASHFLRRVTTEPRHRSSRLSLTIVPTPRFRLPDDASRPVVMLAAGSGIAPFHAFVAARGAGTVNTLYLGVRTPAEFVQHSGLDDAAAAGRLQLHVAFSRADASVSFDGTTHVTGAGTRAHVDDLLRRPEHADRLWRLLTQGAHVYVCGSARFAASMMQALTAVARRGTGSDEEARDAVRRINAQGRLGLDVFTTYLGHAQEGRTVEASELATRNTPDDGYWTAIDGRVLDVGELLHLHVGGPHILRNHTGLDATAAYRRVLHDVHPEIDAQLGMYEIGRLRRLRFAGRWGVVLDEDGLRSMPLEDLFTAWVRQVYLISAMENALAADHAFAGMPALHGQVPGEFTLFTAQFLVEAHRRFLISHLDGLVGDDLRTLWRATLGFCDPAADIRGFDVAAHALEQLPDRTVVHGSVAGAHALVLSGDDPDRTEALCRAYAHADAAVLRTMKEALLDGLRAFEQHEADVIEQAGPRLVAALRQALDAVGDYYRRLAEVTLSHGLDGDGPQAPVPADRGLPGHGGPLG